MNKQRSFLFIPLFIFVVLLGLFFRGLSLDPNAMPSALLNKPVPQFSLPRLENLQELQTQNSLQGKVTLLNVWATTCVTCKEEHAFLRQLSSQGIHIVGVDHKDDTVDAQRWIAQLGNPYDDIIVDEEGRLGLDLGVFGLPETYVIDKHGVIRYKHIGDLNQRVWDETIQPIVKNLQQQI
ncbi:MAG: DsbE family thiol:disulfide interchange protein [Gammaproteobacteria bacterium]|nr:MAG: DsbE family thiol:disulfide interchange protein [Gammaproteobacteria bacterium]